MNNSELIWKALNKNNVDKVAYLPCNKLNNLMKQCPDNIKIMDITRESTGLGLCFGRSLAGKRSAMFIQNTGLGNLVTELYTLQKLYQETLPIFVSWRGYYKEPIEAQVIFGEKVEALLNAIDVEYKILKKSEDLKDIEADLKVCFDQKKVKVYLMSPELWETSSANYHVFGQPKLNSINVNTDDYIDTPSLTRYGAIESAMQVIADDEIVIAQIGFPSRELYKIKDRDTNFYLLGALGSATEVAIGMAQEMPNKHIYVMDGDGSFFFNPNQLFDLAKYSLTNISVICLDNGSWGSTGNQPTLSSNGCNISAIIRSLGLESTGLTDNVRQFQNMLNEKINFIHFLIKAGNNPEAKEIPDSAIEIKRRFMQHTK